MQNRLLTSEDADRELKIVHFLQGELNAIITVLEGIAKREDLSRFEIKELILETIDDCFGKSFGERPDSHKAVTE